MEQWTVESRAFVVVDLFKNNEYVTVTQRNKCNKLHVTRLGAYGTIKLERLRTRQMCHDSVTFPTHLMSCFGDVALPAWCPGLTACDF
ncbi:hypothetical protein J6590_040795 [Homalodisca vitripennis]|nr:hypothetical protein J6590_040795 [Homalodisca vitripennis]